MQHFYQNIQGWFGFQPIYEYIVPLLKDGNHIVEVGAWKGKSTSFMAVEIVNRNLQVQFDVVDTWQGSVEHLQGQPHEDWYAVNGKLYEHFLNNMEPVKGHFNPVRMTSLEAASTYPDESLDFVLIDASHDYENVRADILAWMPKVKKGGVLAGDDYHLNWPGVIQAVNETVPLFWVFNGCCWMYRKP